MGFLNFYTKIFKYQKKFPKLLTIAFLSNLFMCFFDGAVPLIVALLFDSISKSKNIVFILVLLVLNFFGLIVSSVIQKKMSAKLGATTIGDMRFLILNKIQSQSTNFEGENTEGKILANFTSALSYLDNSLLFIVWKSLGLVITGIIAAIILFYFEWHLALVVCIIMLCVYKVPNLFSKKAGLNLKQKNSCESNLVEMVQEEIALQKVIRIFLLTEYRKIAFKKILLVAEKFHSLYGFNLGLVGNTAFLSTHLLRIAVLIIGVFLVVSNRLTLTELTGFYLALGNLSVAISSFSSTYSSLSQGATSLDQIEEFLNETKPQLQNKVAEKILPQFSKEIVFKDVFFKYKEEYVLSNVNFEIKAGQSVAFVGPSGSGKSTVLKLLLRDNLVTNGEILFDGVNLGEIDYSSLFSQIGVIYQDSMLFNTTVSENIRMGNQSATEDEIIVAAKKAEMHEDILKLPLGYNSPVGKRNHSLSGGQSQRIAIARALISNPSILFIDEATSALDPLNCEAIDKTLDKMSGDHTLISVTHRLKSAINADQIFVMQKGEIVERGNHHELLAKQGLYFQLWEKQHGVILSKDQNEGYVNPLWLKFVPMFKQLEPEFLKLIGVEFEFERFEENQIVFNEGDRGDKFYIIASGSVSVSQFSNVTNKNEILTTLIDGDFFGEIALLRNEPRNATLETKTICIFMTLTSHRFSKIFSVLPENLKEKLIAKVNERL